MATDSHALMGPPTMQAPPAVKAAIKERLLGPAQAGGGVRLVMTAEQRVPELEPDCNVIKVRPA